MRALFITGTSTDATGRIWREIIVWKAERNQGQKTGSLWGATQIQWSLRYLDPWIVLSRKLVGFDWCHIRDGCGWLTLFQKINSERWMMRKWPSWMTLLRRSALPSWKRRGASETRWLDSSSVFIHDFCPLVSPSTTLFFYQSSQLAQWSLTRNTHQFDFYMVSSRAVATRTTEAAVAGPSLSTLLGPTVINSIAGPMIKPIPKKTRKSKDFQSSFLAGAIRPKSGDSVPTGSKKRKSSSTIEPGTEMRSGTKPSDPPPATETASETKKRKGPWHYRVMPSSTMWFICSPRSSKFVFATVQQCVVNWCPPNLPFPLLTNPAQLDLL